MAKKVILVDDVDGTEIDDNLGGGTVHFSIEGKDYSIDLGVKNREAFFKAFDKWIENATELPRGGASAPRQRRSSAGDGRAYSGSGRSKEELQAIRDWAASQNLEVSPRGRIKQEIIDQYDAAHQSKAS